MEKLTDKQIANRAYHAKNAEKIRAKKREQYAKRRAAKPVKPKLISKSKTTPDIKKTVVKVKCQPEDLARMRARRRIEDFKLAKELGCDVDDF